MWIQYNTMLCINLSEYWTTLKDVDFTSHLQVTAFLQEHHLRATYVKTRSILSIGIRHSFHSIDECEN